MVLRSVATLGEGAVGVTSLGLTGVIADFSGGGVEESVAALGGRARRRRASQSRSVAGFGLAGIVADFIA